jgi:two-component system, OmpR family, sensor histidine kinase KdpD
LYLPLQTSKGKVGVLGVNFEDRKTLTLDDHELLEMFASQIAVMIERYGLIESASQARVTEESDRLHRTLLDSVSHELKTPLAVISAATDGLDTQLEEAAIPLGKTFLDEIKSANKRLGRIVSNLLDMTRIETGRLPLNLEWCDVGDLLESAVEQLKNEISTERVQIIVPGDMPLVRLDFGMIEQALCNLLMNAAMYSPAGTPIQMLAHLEKGDLFLRVTDQGRGLTPGEEMKVFEKFYRGSESKPGGTGLGLSIVQGLVRAHHGDITAENNPTRGATFTIRLPVDTTTTPPS